MTFHFRLAPVEDIPPWKTAGGDSYLSWYGLTDGWFWIEADGHELFRYSRAAQDYWQQSPESPPPLLPYEDYQIARYWEDLLEMLPAILDPLPDNLATRVADASGWRKWQEQARCWQEERGDDASWDTYYTASQWWGARTWDAGHLAYPPHLWLWRVGETLHLRWDNREVKVEGIPVWEAAVGEVTLPISDFLSAVHSFHERLLSEMGQRVEAALVTWTRPDVAIDTGILCREQEDRSGWLESALTPQARQIQQAFPWETIQIALEILEQAGA